MTPAPPPPPSNNALKNVRASTKRAQCKHHSLPVEVDSCFFLTAAGTAALGEKRVHVLILVALLT